MNNKVQADVLNGITVTRNQGKWDKGELSEEVIDQIADRVIEKIKATQERQLYNRTKISIENGFEIDFNKFKWSETSYINE